MSEDEKEAAGLFEVMKKEHRVRINKSWPFKSMKVGDFYKVTADWDYGKAVTAALQIGQRRGWVFAYKWHDDKGYGLIGRTE